MIKSKTRGGQHLLLGYLGHPCHHKGPSKGKAGGSKQDGGRGWREEFQDGGGEGPGAKGCRQLLEAEERKEREFSERGRDCNGFPGGSVVKNMPAVQEMRV